MIIENPIEYFVYWLFISCAWSFFVHFIFEFPLNFGLDEVFYSSKKDELIIQGSQSRYLTKVSKNLKTVNDYQEDFILVCCHILRTRTQEDIQDLLKQILCTIEDSNITSKSTYLDDDLFCDIRLKHFTTKNRSKQDIDTTNIQFRLFGSGFSDKEIMQYIQQIREHYTGTIGNARSEFIAEMYTHLYNEPCLADEDQLNRINKTPKEILDCYHRHPENPTSFMRSLLKN
jgi:hypothetical protein